MLRPVRKHRTPLVRRGLLRAMSQPRKLPMASAGRTLNQTRLGEQLDRYRRLSRVRDGDAQRR
jgi:hypothetical protein